MSLPTVIFGGEAFYDIGDYVAPDRAIRVRTIGEAVHHSVGQTHFPDINSSGSNLDEVIQHIVMIDEYHESIGYGGFGYNAAVSDTGDVFVVGQALGQRAHVAFRNHELVGAVFLGTHTAARPSDAAINGMARFTRAIRRRHGDIPARGHGQWAVPGWESDCPGAGGLAALPTIIASAELTVETEETDMDRQEITNLIDGAIRAQVLDPLGAWQHNHEVNLHDGGEPPAPTRTYTVVPGDTLGKIAEHYGTTANAIAVLNSLTDPNLISVGQVLVIP